MLVEFKKLNLNCVCFGKQIQFTFDISNIEYLVCNKIELQCSKDNDSMQLTYNFNEHKAYGHYIGSNGGLFPPQLMTYDDFKYVVAKVIYQKMDIESISYITPTNLYVCKSNCYSGKISEYECRLLLDKANYVKNDD
jgi:hypothetical protein